LADRPLMPEVEPLGPDSLQWRLGFPRLGLLLAGRALLLQVAHPVVGAGVRDHSNFRADPWGRLERTVESLLLQLFGGAATAAEGQRLRALHTRITGTGFDGRPYAALDLEAGAWVHISNFDTVVVYHQRFGRGLSPADVERLWGEWRRVGRLLAIPAEHLPETGVEAERRVASLDSGRLGPNPTVDDLLDAFTLADVAAPYPVVPGPLWRGVRRPAGRLLSDLTVGTAPPALRDCLDLPWTVRDQRRLTREIAVVRAAERALPDVVAQAPVARQARRWAARATRPGA